MTQNHLLPQATSRYSIRVVKGNTEDGIRPRIVVVDTKPDYKFGVEILSIRQEPNGQWITENTVDQSRKKTDSLCIAASYDEYSGRMFSDCDVRFPYDFSEAAELANCISNAYGMAKSIA